ncbi:MAG: hypothetical protein ACE5EX_11380 [Phycisphaerae bacterium]
MTYKVYITDQGQPKTGLSPTWSSLYAADGTDKSGSAPAITVVGGGWYKFEVTYGTAPFDVVELVGVIDAGSALSSYERYIPVTISLRDLALTKLVNKANYDLVTGIETVRNDADDGNELKLTLSQTGDVESRVPSGG